MSVSDVCQRWGEQPLNIEEFKSANDDVPVRAKMTCSLLKNQKEFIGIDSSEVKKFFGPYSGYFVNDYIPSYLIEIGEESGQDSWQIVFFIDDDGKISKIVVHKNCCDHRRYGG